MLYKQLQQFGKVKVNEPLSKHTTFKIGGPADFFVTVDRVERLSELLTFLRSEGVSYVLFGGGSNMLVRDEGFRGVVIQCKDTTVTIDGTMVTATAGALTAAVAQQSVQAGLVGFEWGVGVPGTIGGATRGNAGAMNREMTDSVYSVDVYRDGEIFTIAHGDCAFGYRDSLFKHTSDIILRVRLQLEMGDKKEAMSKIMDCLTYRRDTQPKGFASTGCIFKNFKITDKTKIEDIPEQFVKNAKIPAGWLVEQVGMKGMQQGQAQVSERHGNFIINLGEASAADVLFLIEQVKEKVYNTYGITLEEEIYII